MITPPPNPRAEQARADIAAYNAPLLVNPPHDFPPPAPSLADVLPLVLSRWPDMARYAETARVESLHHARGWCWCVTVTVVESEK